MNVDSLIIDLEVMAQIREHDKLGVNVLPGSTVLVVDSASYTQPLRRWYAGRGRREALKYVAGIVAECECAAGALQMGDHVVATTSLVASITRACEGLQHLRTTYGDDSVAVANLSLCLQKLDEVLRLLRPDAPARR